MPQSKSISVENHALPQISAAKRIVLNIIGLTSVVLAVLGVVLPLLPTTPFLLLASGCFCKSSPRFHTWLHQHKVFGAVLTNWQQHKAVSRTVKVRGAITMLFTFSLSIFFAPLLWIKAALLMLLIVLLTWFIRLPVRDLVVAEPQ